MADFHEKLHNELTQGTFVGFTVSGKRTSQSFPGASGYLAGYGPFTMTDSSPEDSSSGNYEVFYNKNSRSFIDKDKCINWANINKMFICLCLFLDRYDHNVLKEFIVPTEDLSIYMFMGFNIKYLIKHKHNLLNFDLLSYFSFD